MEDSINDGCIIELIANLYIIGQFHNLFDLCKIAPYDSLLNQFGFAFLKGIFNLGNIRG